MVLTNEQVALLLERKRRADALPRPRAARPAADRVPDRAARVPRRADAGDRRARGPDRGRAGSRSRRASLVAAEAKRRGHGAASLSSLVLRAMKPARYSEENLGHAGLGSPAYAHFTSPIRRYPDLIAHRALLSTVDGSEEAPDRPARSRPRRCSAPTPSATRCGSSATATTSASASCSSDELFERGPETVFEGEVSGVIRAGAFIRFSGEISDVYEGFFPVRRMKRRPLRPQRRRDRPDRRAHEPPGRDRRRDRGQGRVGRGRARPRRPDRTRGAGSEAEGLHDRSPPQQWREQRRRAQRREGAPMSDDAAKAAKAAKRGPDVATNREARYSYEIVETFEVGVMLQGPRSSPCATARPAFRTPTRRSRRAR